MEQPMGYSMGIPMGFPADSWIIPRKDSWATLWVIIRHPVAYPMAYPQHATRGKPWGALCCDKPHIIGCTVGFTVGCPMKSTIVVFTHGLSWVTPWCNRLHNPMAQMVLHGGPRETP